MNKLNRRSLLKDIEDDKLAEKLIDDYLEDYQDKVFEEWLVDSGYYKKNWWGKFWYSGWSVKEEARRLKIKFNELFKEVGIKKRAYGFEDGIFKYSDIKEEDKK